MTTAKPEDDLESLVGTKPKADEATKTQNPPAPGNVVNSAGTTITSHSPYDVPNPEAKGSVATDEQVTEDEAAEDQSEQDGLPPFRRPVLDSHSPYDRPKPPEPPVNP